MCIPLFCTGETDCIRRMSPFCLPSVAVASLTHILDREVSLEVDRLSLPSLPECRPGPSFDSSGLHMTDTSSIPDMRSRETLSVRWSADNPKSALPNLPLVVVWMAPSLDRWSLVSLSARISGCGIFLSFPQPVVPDSPSGVDFLSPVLPAMSSREFRPESSDITGL